MERQVEMRDGEFVVDAELVSELLAVAEEQVPMLMRDGAITCVCERGIADDAGAFRLSFFYRNRRACVSIDGSGRILQRSIADSGQQPVK